MYAVQNVPRLLRITAFIGLVLLLGSLSGAPAQVGVSAGDEHSACGLSTLHRVFVLNVPTA